MRIVLYNLLLIFLFSCTSKKDEGTAPPAVSADPETVVLTDAQIRNAGIRTGKPEWRNMSQELKVNGVIDVPPQNMVTISFPSGGYLKSTGLLPGMPVRKGEVIAVMQDPSFIQLQQDYLVAKAKLQFLEKEYQRQRELNTTKATSDKVYEQTASDYAAERVMVSSLGQKLLLLGISPSRLSASNISRTVNIYAPISGYVADVKVNIGKYVSPTDVLFELVNTNDLHLALTVFEKDLPSIRPGQHIKAYLTNDSSKTYPAEVVLVGKTLDSNRSALVHCHFIGALPRLLPGMFMKATISTINENILAVPEEAVVRTGDQEYVFVEQQPHKFKLTPVSTTITQNGYVALHTAKGKLDSATIIRNNAYAALMKMKNTGEDEE